MLPTHDAVSVDRARPFVDDIVLLAEWRKGNMRYKALPVSIRGGGPARPERLSPPRPRRNEPRRLRDWLASLSPLVLVAVVLAAAQHTSANAPSLQLSGTAVPGGTVVATGSSFSAGAAVQLLWDGAPQRMPTAVALPDGTFTVDFKLHPQTAGGPHRLDAALVPSAGNPHDAAQILATVTVVVASPAATPPPPTPAPTPVPTAVPTAVPTVAPTAVPTVAPTAVPTVAPTAHPTVHPTPAPTTAPAAPPAGTPDPVNCTGYPEPRIFLEVQSWWEGTNTNGMAHLHAGTCFPLGQTVSGDVRFDTRITMHNNPGLLYNLSTDLYVDGQGSGTNVKVPLDLHCQEMTCVYWVTTTVDTRGANDGWHEFRFKPRVMFADGRGQLTSSGWVVWTENGNPDGSSREAAGKVIGRGWYDGHGYQNPDIRDMSVLLRGPVSGVWTFPVRLDAGADAFVPTYTAAYIDPSFHDGHAGLVVYEANGPYQGNLAIDTTSLANGPHRLVMRVESTQNGETNGGVMVYPFVVQN